MSIANEVVGKKFCNESFVGGNGFEILKERLLASFPLPNEFFDLHTYNFCPTTHFITPSLTIYSVFDELLWSTTRDNIYV
jgi:hypothetical protein